MRLHFKSMLSLVLFVGMANPTTALAQIHIRQVASGCNHESIAQLRATVAHFENARVAPGSAASASAYSSLSAELARCYISERAVRTSQDSPLRILDEAAVDSSVAASSWRDTGNRAAACDSYRHAESYFATIINDRGSYGPAWLDQITRNGAVVGQRTNEGKFARYCT